MVKPEHWFRVAKLPFLVYKPNQDANNWLYNLIHFIIFKTKYNIIFKKQQQKHI